MSIRHLVLAAALTGIAGAASAADNFTLRIASPTVGDMTAQWMTVFKANVEKKAGGKIKVELYPSGQLGPIPATVDGVALGTIEIAAPATGFLAGLEPRFLALEVPGLFDDMAHANRVLLDPAVRARFATYGKTKGVEPLVVFAHSPLMLLSHKPVKTVADFTGQKIRIPGAGPLYVEPMKKLGALPVSLPLGEVLPALQSHAIDGFIAGSAIFTSMKFYDIAKGLTPIPSGIISVGALANTAFLKSLGPDLEKMVREEAVTAYSESVDWSDKDSQATTEVWKKNGGALYELSAAEKARYLELATAVLPGFLGSNPAVKEDYEALTAAAVRQRR